MLPISVDSLSKSKNTTVHRESTDSDARIEITMKAVQGATLSLIVLPLCVAEVIQFDWCPPGGTPPGWTFAMTHDGGAARWEIVRDDTAPTPPYVLAQTSRDP